MNILELKNKITKEREEPPRLKRVYCPKCKSLMVERESRPGLKSKHWYGCSAYPKCKSIVLDINLKDKHYNN